MSPFARPFLRGAALALCVSCGTVRTRSPETHSPAASPRLTGTRPVVIGYSVPSRDAFYPPFAYDYGVYTHLVRAFLEPHADGSVTSPDLFWNADLERLTRQHHVRLLASVGGGSRDATPWLTMARDDRARTRFFDELERLVTIHGYDGVDIDWEPPARDAADERTFTEFMQALRARFPHWILTTALGTGDWNAAHVDWPKVAAAVDYVNLMTYSYSGEWSGHSGHNAALYRTRAYSDRDALDVDAGVRAVVSKYGVASNKLALGLPFFGLQFSTDALGEPFGDASEYRGQEIDYSDVALLESSRAYAERWDDAAHVPYMERKAGGRTLSFDDPRSVADKCAYAREHALAGVMIWYVGADVAEGRPALERAVARAIGIQPVEPTIAGRRQYYRARRAQPPELEARLQRAKSDLLALDPNAASALAMTPVSDAPELPPSDAEALAVATRSVEAEIVRLRAALDEVEDRLRAVPIDVRRGRRIAATARTLSLGSFDAGLEHPLGGDWRTEFDHNGLGTTLKPFPLFPAVAGSGMALHVFGHFGKSRAPWPYASVLATFAKADLGAFAAIRFRAKGDGKRYTVAVLRESVRDHATPRAEFDAGSDWTPIEIPFAGFRQPEWGQRVAPGWFDVTGIAFAPDAQFDDEDFDLWIDDVELVAR